MPEDEFDNPAVQARQKTFNCKIVSGAT